MIEPYYREPGMMRPYYRETDIKDFEDVFVYYIVVLFAHLGVFSQGRVTLITLQNGRNCFLQWTLFISSASICFSVIFELFGTFYTRLAYFAFVAQP